MAISVKLEAAQFEQLTQGSAVAQEIKQGFEDLIAVLGGADDETIQSYAQRLRGLREKLQTSINKQPKGE